MTRLRAREGWFVTLAWVVSVWRRGGLVSVSAAASFLAARLVFSTAML